ncbi:uncharacterized protein [Watersipora subatra]|uniref:uncharacterized protein n=1 Tax=Watersipora subatra TaxID=2589382 RepID=UPI00355B69F1
MTVDFKIIFVLAGGFILAHGQVPIPHRPLGFVYKNASHAAPIHLDVFFDLACPDSKMAFPVMKQLADMYGDKTIKLKMLVFPLPYHRNAHFAAKATQAAYVNPLNGQSPDDAAVAWIQTAFTHQMKWSDSMTAQLNYDQTQSLIASYSEALGYDAVAFKKLMSSMTSDQNARVMWKYGCTRGVAGTPWFFVNGVYVGADGSWTVTQWKQVIDALLQGRNVNV